MAESRNYRKRRGFAASSTPSHVEETVHLTCNQFNLLINYIDTSTCAELKKDHVVRGMLYSIINSSFKQNKPSINIQKLQSEFIRLYGKDERQNTRTFESISGSKLKIFLERHRDIFNLQNMNGALVITGINDRKMKNDLKYISCAIQTIDQENVASGLNAESKNNSCVSKHSLSTPKEGKQSLKSNKTEFSYDNTTKGTENKMVIHKEQDYSFTTDTEEPCFSKYDNRIYKKMSNIPTDAEFSLAEKILLQRLKHPSDGILLLQKEQDFYIKDPLQFMIDIVSIWNTPNRGTSHIVLGAYKKHNVIYFFRETANVEKHRNLFLDGYFHPVPDFQFIETSYFGSKIIAIEIISSCGKGQPSMSTKGLPQKNLEIGQIIVYDNPYKICGPSDIMTVMSWFLQTSPSVTNIDAKKEVQRKNISKYTINFSNDIHSLCKDIENFDVTKGDYILVIGGSLKDVKNIDALGAIPWLYVFDFDTDCDVKYHCEKRIQEKRSLYTVTWDRLPPSPNSNATVWCYVCGHTGQSDSLVTSASREWLRDVVHGIEGHFNLIGRYVTGYTVLRILILWGPDEERLPHLTRFLQKLDENISDPHPEVIMCLNNISDSQETEMAIQTIRSSVSLKSLYEISLEELCMYISETFTETKYSTQKFELPAQVEENEKGVVSIDEKDAAWLNETLEVLYLKRPFKCQEMDSKAVKEEEDNFFKGGTLSWQAWYSFGIDNLDVTRDLMLKVQSVIKDQYITPYKSGCINLFHAPGAGGTTLAQRILMELRTETPCSQVKVRGNTSIEDVCSKLSFIYDNTCRPILLAVDGEDENWVRQLRMSTNVIKVIIFHIKRYPYPISFERRDDTFYLKGHVSKIEAPLFVKKFSKKCNNKVKLQNIQKLESDVVNGKEHYVFEFGLAVYYHEFKGIEKYVNGYLNLPNDGSVTLLSPWHVALSFLSLVFFYGQISMPCQFFRSVLKIPPMAMVGLEYFDIGKELIVWDQKEERSIRIAHYLIAREILDQILVYPRLKSEVAPRPHSLSHLASLNLKSLACDFIAECGKFKKKATFSFRIQRIIVATFISRDNKEVGEDTLDVQRKHPFARLIEDIPSKPPYAERLDVLEKLTQTFPDDPGLHAHLGRFYFKTSPEKLVKAIDCLNLALELCDSESSQRRLREDEEHVNNVRVHSHHMYGMLYMTHISEITGRKPGDIPKIKTTNEDDFHSNVQKIVEEANKAIYHFKKSYFYMIKGNSGAFTDHALVGEMDARLSVCDYVQRYYKPNGCAGYIKKPSTSVEVKTFLQESIPAIDQIILECYSMIENNDISRAFQDKLIWYQLLFRKVPNIVDWVKDIETVDSRRFKIAALKQKHYRKGIFCTTLKDVKDTKDIEEIVKLYEDVFEEAKRNPVSFNEHRLDSDFKEWLIAIRHELFQNNYSLVEVLQEVRQWNEITQSPLSNFYVFVLTSLLGFGNEISPGSSHCLIEALRMLPDLAPKKPHFIRKPRFPREWWGKTNDGIKSLIPGSFLGNLDHLSLSARASNTELKICRGNIRSPNLARLKGEIQLDLGPHALSRASVRVFFIPIVNKLYGRRYEGMRVDFYLGFSLEHGYEAFQVQELKRENCQRCNKFIELSQKDTTAKCVCGNVVHADR